MNLLHLEHAGKTARVGLASVPDARPKLRITQRTSAGDVARVRVMNGIASPDPARLKPDDLLNGDPEIAPAFAGRRLDVDLTAAWFDPSEPDPQPVGEFKEVDVIVDPQGAEKERRAHVHRSPNINTLHPVKLGRRLPLKDALTGFVFRGCHQLVHEDGLTMEFLFNLAKDLHDKQEAALLGAGPKGNLPLVTREGGSPCRAFLFGEVRGEEYRLVVMLSDQELKKPQAAA